jgi:hypothetical protein
MLNDRPNNIDWKNKLGELESSASDVFNKEASWSKLHIRLQTRQKNKKAIWYWLAAACLFFALVISFFLTNKKENVLVKNNPEQKNINSSSFQHVPIVHKDTSAIISSSLIENKIPVHSINDIEKVNTVLNHKIIRTEIVQDKKEENITRELINNAVMPVDTAIGVAIKLPEKKKLKVVHINELGEPAEISPDVARNSIIRSFQFKFAGEEVYSNHPEKSNTSGFTILKSKKFPN